MATQLKRHTLMPSPLCEEPCMPVAGSVDNVPCRQMEQANLLKRHVDAFTAVWGAAHGFERH